MLFTMDRTHMRKHRIIIDAMGGDHAPEEIIKGAAQASRISKDFQYVFVGIEEQINALLDKYRMKPERSAIIPATEVIGMDEPPKEAVDEKPNASINVAARLIRDGEGDALVSAGSTGATIIACSRAIPRIPGIERGVLAAIFPPLHISKSSPGVTMMLDVGATLHCTVNQLVSFAIMGTQYLKGILGVDSPRVGLLNIGEEETKGHSVLVETNQALRHLKSINFIGNVEGKDILRGVAEVIVTEGLTGNVVLKSLEGMAEATIQTGKQIWKRGVLSKMGIVMLAPALRKIKKRVDYSEYGGAPILGFQKLIIKAHGRSKAKAIKNAILLAEKSAKNNIVRQMEESMKAFYLSLFEHGESRPSDEGQ